MDRPYFRPKYRHPRSRLLLRSFSPLSSFRFPTSSSEDWHHTNGRIVPEACRPILKNRTLVWRSSFVTHIFLEEFTILGSCFYLIRKWFADLLEKDNCQFDQRKGSHVLCFPSPVFSIWCNSTTNRKITPMHHWFFNKRFTPLIKSYFFIEWIKRRNSTDKRTRFDHLMEEMNVSPVIATLLRRKVRKNYWNREETEVNNKRKKKNQLMFKNA